MKSIVAALVAVALVAAPSFGAINITLKGRVGTTGTFSSVVDTDPMDVGKTLTVQLWGQGTDSGLLAVGGNIVANGSVQLGTPSQMSWTAKTAAHPDVPEARVFVPQGSFCGAGFRTNIVLRDADYVLDEPEGYTFASTAYPAGRPTPCDLMNFNKGGTPGANGSLSALGSGQTPGANLDSSFGKAAPVLLGSYTVPITSTYGVTILNWVEAPLVGSTHVGYGGFYTVGTQAGDWSIGTTTGLIIADIPEPATLALLALGSLLVARRRHV